MRLGGRRRSMRGRAVLGVACSALCWALGCGQNAGEPAPGDGDSAGGGQDTNSSGDGDTGEQPCERDADCDDGKYCTGSEQCDPDHAKADSAGCVTGKKPCGDSACLEEERACGCETPDRDQDGYDSIACGGEDCDDDDEDRFPGNTEVCDDADHDEDCDPKTFGERDEDGDDGLDEQCCNADEETGEPNCGDDCDDQDPNSYRGNTETCDDVDNDCDGVIDELPDSDEPDGLKQQYTEDKDRDGYGSRASSADRISACKTPKDYALAATDCDDDVAEVNPGAYDSCEDTIDNDCSDVVNDPEGGCSCEGNVSQTCGDGGAGLKGKCATYERQCNNGQWDDCPLKPGAQAEVCNELGEDEDCDGLVDEAVAESPELEVAGSLKQAYFRDRDGDGYPDLSTSAPYCPDLEPAGWITDENPNDCVDVALGTDPLSANIFPGAPELCNSRDDDCAGGADEAPLTGSPTVAGTTFTCVSGEWDIVDSSDCPTDTLHCDTNLENGCETSGTTLQNCHECGNSCLFACGVGDCDPIATLSAGLAHTCAVTAGGRVACWGKNASREAHDSTTNPVLQPAFVSGITGATAVAAGDVHTCVIDAGLVKCWGSDGEDQLGPLAAGQTLSGPALQVTGLTGVTSLASGRRHSCAVDSTGRVRCWGERDGGKLGNGIITDGRTPNPTTVTLPDAVTALSGAVQVVAGRSHSCARTSEGKVYCWGDHSSGQLGIGAALSEGYAMDTGLTGVAHIAAGSSHTCAVLSGGGVRCWGSNDSLQVGVTPEGTFTTPQTVAGISNGAQISAGGGHTCVRRSNNAVSCWGSNASGERGEASPSTPTATPTSVSGLAASLVSAGAGGHSCAVSTTTGQGVCWGANTNSQLGNGLLVNTSTRQNILAIP